MVLGRGSSLALFIAIALAVGSCLVLVAWRRTRKAKKKADDGELAEVGVVGAVEAGAPRATGRQDRGISKEPTREPQKCSSIEVLDNPSPAVANGWPVEGTTSEVTPVVASGGSSASESAAGSLVAVAADLGTAAVDSNLAELAAAGNEHEALPTSQESPTGRDESNGEITTGIGAVAPGNEEVELSDARVEQLEVPLDSGEQTEAAPDEQPERSVEAEATGKLAAESGVPDESAAEQFVHELDEVDGERPEEVDGTPARYRPPRLVPGKPQKKKSANSLAKDEEPVLGVRIRCISDRHGFCRFALLAQRPAGAPAEVEVRQGRRVLRLSEAADDWYEIADVNDLSMLIERGTTFSVAEGDDGALSWELRGRDLYVLGALHGVSGSVSTTRLSLDREQIVLCRENEANAVETILAEAGSRGLHAYGPESGSPAGWVFFRPVTPSRSIPQVPGDDIRNLIRPVPDIEVVLEGGLWLWGSAWMAGYPPRVHITGEMPAGAGVTIDGELAEESEGRIFCTLNSEHPGTHLVWCDGKTASYSICEPEEGWEQWEAWRFPRGVVCGAVALRGGASDGAETLTSVPTTNPVLIGAKAGEIFGCDARPGKQWSGFVPFPVCWALPMDPLHCDRSLQRVLLVKPVAPDRCVASKSTGRAAPSSVLQWCYAIRNCQRKRLAVSPDDAASERLWKEYAAVAKTIWRAAR